MSTEWSDIVADRAPEILTAVCRGSSLLSAICAVPIPMDRPWDVSMMVFGGRLGVRQGLGAGLAHVRDGFYRYRPCLRWLDGGPLPTRVPLEVDGDVLVGMVADALRPAVEEYVRDRTTVLRQSAGALSVDPKPLSRPGLEVVLAGHPKALTVYLGRALCAREREDGWSIHAAVDSACVVGVPGMPEVA